MSEVPPDLRERKWRIQAIGNADWVALSKLFPFSNSEQLEKFMQGVTKIQSALNHHGELSLYEGEDRVRFSTWTMEKENDTTDPITETDFRLARQIETLYTNLMKEGTPKPALFLDFDGTVRDVVEDPARAHKGGFRAPYRPEEVAVYPQVADILELWEEDGYFLVGATNQSGVGRGDLTEASAVECIEETVNQIGIGFPVYYSTSKKGANYKPRIGMGLEAIEEHGPFDLDESIMVGDNHRGGDENFAYNLGLNFIHADDFFHLSKDQRKGRAAESFTEQTFHTEHSPRFSCIPTADLFTKLLPHLSHPPTEQEFKELKVVELKGLLKGRGLAVSGRKAELIERLLEDALGYYKTLIENPRLPQSVLEDFWQRRLSQMEDNEDWEHEWWGNAAFAKATMSASFINAKIEETAMNTTFRTSYSLAEGDLDSRHELWKYLSQNPYLPPEIIEQHWGKWNMGHLSENPSLTPEIIEAHWNDKGEAWAIHILSGNPALTPEIIEKYWDAWDKVTLVRNHFALTTEIVENHWDELLPHINEAPYHYNNELSPFALWAGTGIWPNLNPTWITPELIEKGWGHWGDVDYLGDNPALTMELIRKHLNEFEIDYLGKNPNLTLDFILTHHEVAQDDLGWNPNPEILAYLIETFPEIYLKGDTARYHIARNPNLPEELMEKHWSSWDYDDVAQNPHLSPEIMEKHWKILEVYTADFILDNPSLFPCGNLAGAAGFPSGIINWRL